jgi:hypothetical protein
MILITFIAYTAFCYWVVFRDGADVLEGWKSFFLFGWFAATLTTSELKFYIAISWLGGLALVLHRLFFAQPGQV